MASWNLAMGAQTDFPRAFYLLSVTVFSVDFALLHECFQSTIRACFIQRGKFFL